MIPTPGARLGPYEIKAQIGAGGMGVVYRARDTKLGRDVALKILPEAFVNDADRLARFQREAEVLASLNHPNIAAIHGLEEAEAGGTPALVLEYVEGPTLAELISSSPGHRPLTPRSGEKEREARVRGGALPVEEALPIARQIAEALEAAHERGIIHRDLKPANVKVKADGTVKVLDFGLAKALDPVAQGFSPADDPDDSPTRTAAGTRAGIILGTAAYMSPEQAKGQVVDKRADIWAFGVVLYEMLTGRPLFAGTDVAETLAAVLRADVDWAALPAATPLAIRRLLKRCLERDQRERLRDIGDARLEITEALAAPAMPGGETAAIASPARWQRPAVLVATLVLGLVVGGLIVRPPTRPSPGPPAPVTRLSIALPRTHVRTNTGRRGVAISPAGTDVAYVANEQLYLRPLDALEAQPLEGTEGSAPTMPFFSPDGQWIGFYSQRDGALQKVALTGGASVTLTEATNPFGASWGSEDTILVGQYGRGVLQVPAAGGASDVLVPVELPGVAHQPQMLPGGEAVLYTLGRGLGTWDAAQIVVERLVTGERTVVVDGGSDARYLPTGHLVYALGGTLLAVPFDVERLAVTGGPVPLVEGVSRAGVTGAANADVAGTGTLVYLSRNAQNAGTLVWVDREGNEDALPAPPRAYVYPRLSPDATRVALDVRDEESDIWIWDLGRETLTRLTFAAGSDQYPVWTPDGRQVVFGSRRDGALNVYRRAADGTGAVERLTESPNFQFPQTISPDGARLVFPEGTAGVDLSVLTLGDEPRVEPLIATEFDEWNAEISPDGRWLAYQSNASGQEEIYVQPFPDVETGRWQVSTTGGTQPLWGRDGRELFYWTEAGVMGVPVVTGESFEAGRPGLVVSGSYYAGPRGRTYDVAPDGQRFLMIKEGGTASPDDPLAGLTQIHVVQNWHQELLERVPIP